VFKYFFGKKNRASTGKVSLFQIRLRFLFGLELFLTNTNATRTAAVAIKNDQVRRELTGKGLMLNGNWVTDSFFDVFTDIHISSPDGLEVLVGTAFKGWTKTMLSDDPSRL